MRSAVDDLKVLIEDILDCNLYGLKLELNNDVLFDSHTQEEYAQEVIVSGGAYKASLLLDRAESIEKKDENRLQKILNLFFADYKFPDKSNAFLGADILEDIADHKSVDDVLELLIKTLVNKGGFKRAGIMFLNEVLLELRGVIFGDDNGKIDITSFKNSRVTFEKKNRLSDIMFYDATDIVSCSNLSGNGTIGEYFCDNMLVTGLGIGGKPIGILIACKEKYLESDKEAMNLYGKICSLAIEFSKTLKQLELTSVDLGKMKRSVVNSENLVKMGRLSATIAHELKNPLVAIGGFTKRMEQTAVNPQTKNYIKIVQSEVQRLERIVGDILMYSRRVELDIRRVRLWDIIDENMEILNGCLCFSLIDVKYDIDPDIYIDIDRDKFRQVLMNLTSNSVQEMPEGGELCLSATAGDNYVTLSVADSGCGVPAEKREKIFEPFYTGKKNGTGLGLPLCKKIMNAHGGDITADESDKGALFTLVIPKRG